MIKPKFQFHFQYGIHVYIRKPIENERRKDYLPHMQSLSSAQSNFPHISHLQIKQFMSPPRYDMKFKSNSVSLSECGTREGENNEDMRWSKVLHDLIEFEMYVIDLFNPIISVIQLFAFDIHLNLNRKRLLSKSNLFPTSITTNPFVIVVQSPSVRC